MSKLLVPETQEAEPYNKYGNKKAVSFDGKGFVSIWERDCYEKFAYLKLAKELKEIRCQVRYNLHVNGFLICAYVADFVIVWNDGSEVVYDAKGAETDVFVLKKKLMMAVHGIELKLIKKKDKRTYPWLYARKF